MNFNFQSIKPPTQMSTNIVSKPLPKTKLTKKYTLNGF